MSAEHLQVYLDEFIFRYNRRRTPIAAFQTLLGLSSQHPPPTRAEIVAEGAVPWPGSLAWPLTSVSIVDGLPVLGILRLPTTRSPQLALALHEQRS